MAAGDVFQQAPSQAMRHPMRLRLSPTLILTYMLLTLGAITMMMPFLWMLSTSFKADSDIFHVVPHWIPQEWDFANYRDAYAAIDMGRLFANTSFVTVMDVLAQIVLGSMAGYAFARLRFPGRKPIFFLLLATMMVPFEVLILPIFIFIRYVPLAGGNDITGTGGIGLINSYGGLIFPNLISVFGIFIFRQFFQSFPREIEEAAIIDGCSKARIFWNILIPNSKPVIGTLALFSFLWVWNDFLWPLVVVKEDRLNTLQLGLSAFNQEVGTRWAEMMAGSVMVSIPVLILFLFMQRFLVQGLATTGLKG